MCLAEVSVTEQVLQEFPDLLGELSMRKQCVPGSFFSVHAREPGNEATLEKACLFAAVFSQLSVFAADCLYLTVQMVGVEMIWKLHTLTVINSWYCV